MRRPRWTDSLWSWPDPRPGRRADLGVRPGESDPARGLGVALLLAAASALLIVVVVIAVVWGASS